MSLKKQHTVAFKLSLTAVLSLTVVLVCVMAVVSALIWQDFGRMSHTEIGQFSARMRELVQTFDETAREQARKDFALLKSSFPKNFELQEREGPNGKPESLLLYQEAVLNGDFSSVDRFTASHYTQVQPA